MLCEKCGNHFEEDWRKHGIGVPRFCCSKCARSFSTFERRDEINKNVSKKAIENFKNGRHNWIFNNILKESQLKIIEGRRKRVVCIYN